MVPVAIYCISWIICCSLLDHEILQTTDWCVANIYCAGSSASSKGTMSEGAASGPCLTTPFLLLLLPLFLLFIIIIIIINNSKE